MQELARCASTASDAPPFWIDVMCVPISGAYHSESIRRIRWVYAKAEKVLVLDPSLYTHHVGSCEEALIRIRYSLWKRRLWTLQEGVLAKQLCFKFWDEIVALDELLEQYESSCSFPLLQRQNFDALPINGYLPEILTLLDDDIKTFKKLRRTVPELTEGIDYEKLCRALRLGYLGTPRYRYFIEDDELAPMAEVLRTLAGVYLNPPGMPLQASLRTTEQVLAGLKVVQGIEAFQEQES
ncbi:hypothetical protein TRIVIDRAFT_227713 [Neofusicoccum parvum]|uniref:Uncharacterized protein n=1 Tax=Neofusicoccum parvum TaxID=310453 RepID=A0ACB5RR16_9PEZI|nr:hypothetical protein TRIVIDRAFT_227713 [Neofusicoccum parvum]